MSNRVESPGRNIYECNQDSKYVSSDSKLSGDDMRCNTISVGLAPIKYPYDRWQMLHIFSRIILLEKVLVMHGTPGAANKK